ncbi:MAG: hypothetical protein KA369_07405 [Spirochaetes bacterium]|nr:hypothetical protein [Spirochaetota bacterium]
MPQFAIHHHPDSPAYYDIIIDGGESLATFRIAQFDMLAFLDGTEVKADEVDNGSAGTAPLDKPVSCGAGKVRLFDSGLCAIERWSPPVYLIQVAGKQFYGTIHMLKVEDGYSLRYIRSRSRKSYHR